MVRAGTVSPGVKESHPKTWDSNRTPRSSKKEDLIPFSNSLSIIQKPLEMGVNPLDPTILERLDPEFVKFYEEVIDTRPATHQVPLEEIRSNPAKWAAPWVDVIPEKESIQIRTIPSKDSYRVPVRIYHPDPEIFGQGPFGVHLNFHGTLNL